MLLLDIFYVYVLGAMALGLYLFSLPTPTGWSKEEDIRLTIVTAIFWPVTVPYILLILVTNRNK